MRTSIGFAGLLMAAFIGCSGKQTDKVTMVADDDPRMNAAMQKAKSTVKTFIAALKSPKAGQNGFSIKAPFTDGGGTEHMWLTPVSFDGTKFSGTINNEPEMVKNVKIGQSVTFAPDKISDWMYVENGKLVGGETMRVMRDAANPAERAEIEKSLPFKFE